MNGSFFLIFEHMAQSEGQSLSLFDSRLSKSILFIGFSQKKFPEKRKLVYIEEI